MGHGAELQPHGADTVDWGLAEVVVPERPEMHIPGALERFAEIARRAEGKRIAVFLDYDGTLTPIVARPELAVLSEETRATLHGLSRLCPVAIVSGRDRADVEGLVGIDSLFYAGSHGFDIAGPGGQRFEPAEVAECAGALESAARELQERVRAIAGTLVEPKRYAVAVHYRLVAEAEAEKIRRAVDEVARKYPLLCRSEGKKVFELRPAIAWDKGKAVLWLLHALGLEGPDALGLYVGDDVTDEDAFVALRDQGVGILVAAQARPTRAHYLLRDPAEVRQFLAALAARLKHGMGPR